MPSVFPLIGNSTAQGRLIAAAEADRLHHAYLFEGPEGVGKFTFALWLARFVNCEAPPSLFGPPTARPCEQCACCRNMLAGSHPDLVVVGTDPERATRVISVDQAHQLIRAIQLQRHSARRRFVILDPADAMNDDSANALLKTLEEPPRGTQFVLVSSRVASFLPTIRSRTQRVRFGPVAEAELVGWLQARGADASVARAASGSPGLALRLGGGEAEARNALRDAVLDAVGQPLVRLFAFGDAEGKKDEGVNRAELALEVVEELLRDAALLANDRSEGLLHGARQERLAGWARALWPGGFSRMSGHLAEARLRLRLNVNGRTVLESLLTQLNLELSAAR